MSTAGPSAMDVTLMAAMRRSELALVSIGQVFAGVRNRIAVGLAPTLEAVANAFVALASSTSPISRAFDAVLANLDRLAIYAGTPARPYSSSIRCGTNSSPPNRHALSGWPLNALISPSTASMFGSEWTVCQAWPARCLRGEWG